MQTDVWRAKIMRIGQVSMCGDNYGACLQALALQYILKKNGNDVEFICYNQVNSRASIGTLGKMRSLGFMGLIRYFSEYSYIRNRKDAYRNFRKKFITRSSNTYNQASIYQNLNATYDKFICGSDMIWSEEFQEDWDFYFLKFAAKEKSFSYAPSFGKNSLENENKNRVAAYLQDFSKVTCREEGGVNLIKSISNIPAKQVLDPTMLLDQSEWNKIIDSKDRLIKEPYVLMYLFGKSDSYWNRYVQEIERKYGKAYKLPSCKKESRNFPIDSIGPIEYMRLFRDAEFVITNTFHGLMFSMIFNKQFVVLDRTDASKWAKYSDRMTSTLEMFGLTDRYLFANKTSTTELNTINYQIVNEKIQEKRRESLDYLCEIVGSDK